MQARFCFTSPNMLAEALAGDLFVPLGPDLVECVCALRCSRGEHGIQSDVPSAARFDPDATLGVVVVACRVGAGEPEHYPTGYTTALPAATPIQFLAACVPLQLRPRGERDGFDSFLPSNLASAVLGAHGADRANAHHAELISKL